jgi:hypothetical protein
MAADVFLPDLQNLVFCLGDHLVPSVAAVQAGVTVQTGVELTTGPAVGQSMILARSLGAADTTAPCSVNGIEDWRRGVRVDVRARTTEAAVRLWPTRAERSVDRTRGKTAIAAE